MNLRPDSIEARALDRLRREDRWVSDTHLSEALGLSEHHTRRVLWFLEAFDLAECSRLGWKAVPRRPGAEDRLTNPQREVLGMLRQGLPAEEIARRRGVTTGAAEKMIRKIPKTLYTRTDLW